MPRESKAKWSPSTLAPIAAAAKVDPRTLARYLDGGRTLPANRDAIEKALREAGREDMVRK